MSEETSVFALRCNHEGIGKPGCTTCDPNPEHWRLRARALEGRIAQAEGAVAQLRAALRLAIDYHAGSVWTSEMAHRWTVETGSDEASTRSLCDYLRSLAHNGELGKGWVSPADHAKVHAQAAAMRAWIESKVDDVVVDHHREDCAEYESGGCEECQEANRFNAALATDAGKDWVPRAELEQVAGAKEQLFKIADLFRLEVERLKGEIAKANLAVPMIEDLERQRCAEIVRDQDLQRLAPPGSLLFISEVVRRILEGR